MRQYIRYNERAKTISRAGKVIHDEACNGWVIKNLGNTVLIINKDLLLPGQFKAWGGNQLEIYDGNIDASFRPTDSAQNPQPFAQVIPAVNYAIYTEKFYLPENKFDTL